MAVSSYLDKDKKIRWKVYVNLRSKANKSIRFQKRELGLESKSKADRKEKELLERGYAFILGKDNPVHTWGEVVTLWKKDPLVVSSLQADTLEDYYSAMFIWTHSVWNISCVDINKNNIKSIHQNMVQANKSISYQSKVINKFKRIYEWAKDEGLIKNGISNVTGGLKIAKNEEKAPDILTIEEIRKLLLEAKLRNNKWYPVWSAAVYTGMRSGELFALTWSNVDLVNKVITVSKSYNKRKSEFKSTKAGYFRTVPINDSLLDVLNVLLTTTTTPPSKGDFVFPRIREWGMGLQANELRLFCHEIGIRSVKFHALRACFATHLLSNGVSPAIVMKVAGWRGLDTMQRYTRLAGIYEKGATDCLRF